MADRRAELEKKRAQLAALKAKKTQRDGSVPPSIIPSTSGPDTRLVVDDILKQVGISPESSSPCKRTSLVISDGISVTQQVDREPRRVPKLTLVTLPAASIASKESVTYDKGTQTTTSGGSGSESNDHRHMLDYYGKLHECTCFCFCFFFFFPIWFLFNLNLRCCHPFQTENVIAYHCIHLYISRFDLTFTPFACFYLTKCKKIQIFTHLPNSRVG